MSELREAVARAMYEAIDPIRGESADEDGGEDWYDSLPWQEFRASTTGTIHFDDDMSSRTFDHIANAAIKVIRDYFLNIAEKYPSELTNHFESFLEDIPDDQVS